MLYELFTGKPAFEGTTQDEIVRVRGESTPHRLSTLVRDLDPAVKLVIPRLPGGETGKSSVIGPGDYACGPSPMARCSSPAGQYTEIGEHVIGFWVLKAADLSEALASGRKAALACRAPVEVRRLNIRGKATERSPSPADIYPGSSARYQKGDFGAGSIHELDRHAQPPPRLP